MSYKETFNLDYGMNKWEAGVEPIKPDNSEVKPFIDIAVEVILLACEFGAVKKNEVRTTIRTGVQWLEILERAAEREGVDPNVEIVFEEGPVYTAASFHGYTKGTYVAESATQQKSAGYWRVLNDC